MTQKVLLTVGTNTTDTIPTRYWPDALTLLNEVRKHIQSEMVSNDSRVITALQIIHKWGEIDLGIFHEPTGRVIEIDINGEWITPWPDKFFEIEFELRFHYYDNQP
jgi:hypothetical protein